MPIPLAGGAESRLNHRRHPNIHICGNPATGKTSLARKIAECSDHLTYIDLGREGKSKGCIEGHDEQLDCDILDYEKLADAMTPDMENGGNVVDWIHADFWEPSSLIDLIVVLTCDNTILFDRYKVRNYGERKIEQNIDSEIMQEIVSETQDYYKGEDASSQSTTLTILKSDTEDDMKSNLSRVKLWVERWQPNPW